MSKQYIKVEYSLSEITARIIAAAKEVHYGLSSGYKEVIYQRTLALELPAHELTTAGRNGSKDPIEVLVGEASAW